MSLILYHPVSNSARKRVMPFSLLAIGAVLEGRRPYVIVDGNGAADADAELARLGVGSPVLAVSVMPGPQLEDGYARTRAFRARFPGATVIWGGYFPTEHPEACLAEGLVDFVVRGHGEEALLALLERLERGEDPRRQSDDAPLAGIGWSRPDGRLVIGPVARVPDVNALPEFPFHRLDMAAYPRRTFLGDRTLGYHSSYGCPFLCNFCGVVSLTRGRWNAQSPERVERALRRYASEWSVDAVEFYDNNFFTHEERCVEIATRMAPLRFGWWGEGRIDTLLKFAPASLRTMRESGLRMVFLGAESASAEVLSRMDKGGTLTPQMTLDLAARFREIGITPEFSFVLGNPPDPEADVATTLEFVRTLKSRNPEAEIVLYQYTPVPVAGELLDAAAQSGFAFPKTLEEWVSPRWREVSRRNSDKLPWLAPKVRRRILDFRRVLNAYYPTSTDPRLQGWRRSLLSGAASWRYRSRTYSYPIELQVLQRLLRYQRPETAGF